jgi:surface antigen
MNIMHKTARQILESALAALVILTITAPVFATPPPWAPAHGYRNKHKGGYDYQPVLPWHDQRHESGFIRRGRCDRDRLGAVLGGVVGGVAGSQIGRGSGRTIATIAGTVIGVIVGRSIGRHMDRADQQCVGQALEHAPDRESVYWRDPDTGADYAVTPVNTYRHLDGRYCREYTTRAVIGGRQQQVYGDACRQRDGSWVMR